MFTVYIFDEFTNEEAAIFEGTDLDDCKGYIEQCIEYGDGYITTPTGCIGWAKF